MRKSDSSNTQDVGLRQQEASLLTPTDLKAAATKDITGAMNAILADVGSI
jgi:starvation-inducible DNA-binding protein